jgi:hypothetical protein
MPVDFWGETDFFKQALSGRGSRNLTIRAGSLEKSGRIAHLFFPIQLFTRKTHIGFLRGNLSKRKI